MTKAINGRRAQFAWRWGIVAAEQRAFSGFLESCRRGGRRPAVVLLSSGGTVYSPSAPPPYVETSEVGPTSVYGWAKLAQEQQLLDASAYVRPVILRLSNVYGPGQRLRPGFGVMAHWLAAVAAGKPLVVYGDLATRRDYVYFDNVTDALVRVGTASLDGVVLNIGAGTSTSLAELLDVVMAVVDRSLSIERTEGRPFDRREVWLDVSAARARLGWSPATALPAGVARTWAALTANATLHPASRV
jgi:UDP-glucose 4-epimerase